MNKRPCSKCGHLFTPEKHFHEYCSGCARENFSPSCGPMYVPNFGWLGEEDYEEDYG